MKLSEYCEGIIDCEHKTAETQGEGYPSIRTPNIGRGFFILDGVNRVSDETYRAWTRRAVPKAGDLIMAREAPVGNVALVPEGLQPCLGQRTLLIQPDHGKIDARYLMYVLLGPQIQGAIHGQTNGATVAHLNMSDVRNLDLPALPSLPVQHRIAGILSAYDDLITNCEQRIQLLDEMARALYREWFVLFRYPGHEKVQFVESSLGPIPKGWRLGRVGDVAVETRRGVAKGELEGTVRYVGLEHIPRRSLALDAWVDTIELGSNKLRFDRGEVLFGKIRPYFHKVSIAPFLGICSADTFVISTGNPSHYGFMVALVSSDAFVAHASATANGAKMPRANWNVMMDFPVPLPPTDLLSKFDAVMRAIVEEQQTLVFGVQNLRKTRDLLLPRLLSGQLAVEDAA